MAITYTAAGSVGVHNSSVASASTTPAYNQVAGNTIIVIANIYNQPTFSLSDTAGNTFTPVYGSPITTGGTYVQAWYANNCLGNAANVVKITGSTFFVAMIYLDITGVTVSSPLDYVGSTINLSGGGTVSNVITTTQANEIIFAWLMQVSASMASDTPPTSFTDSGFGVVAQYGAGSYRIVSAIQSSVTLTYTYPASFNSIMLAFSLQAASNTHQLALSGCGA